MTVVTCPTTWRNLMSKQDKAASARLTKQKEERRGRHATKALLKEASGRFDVSTLREEEEAEVDDMLISLNKKV